jgi:hypothetical protein
MSKRPSKTSVEAQPDSIDIQVDELKASKVDIQMEDSETDSRTPRDSETREDSQRKMPWQPSRLLPTPHPSDDVDYRYVCVASAGGIDNMNHSQALRDSWEPVQAKEVPECGAIISDVGTSEGNVVLGGMMLCKRPKYIGDQVRAQIAKESLEQIEAVDQGYLSDQNEYGKKYSDNKSRVTFGGKS